MLLVLVLSLVLEAAWVTAPKASAAYPRPTELRQVDLHLPKEKLSPQNPSISADGRWIAYTKERLRELEMRDVFVTDTKTGRSQLISKGPRGEAAIGPPATPFSGCSLQDLSCMPSISGNGRFVAYMSSATNLVAGDTNAMFDVFVYDRHKGTTERASVSSSGEQGILNSYFPSMNFSGRYVSFTSNAPNLVEGDTNGARDVFVRDLHKNRTIRVSLTSNGEQISQVNCFGLPRTENEDVDFVANAVACGIYADSRSSISYDGRTVAFESAASDVVPGDRNQRFDVFVRDLKSKKTERVSVNSAGDEASMSMGFGQQNNGSRLSVANNVPNSEVGHAISADGRFVVFSSPAPNLVPNDQNGYPDVFVHDRRSDRTTRVSVLSDGSEICLADPGAISGNGRYVAFRGCRNIPEHSLKATDPRVGGDLYRYDLLTGEFTHNSVRAKPDTKWPTIYDYPDLDRSGSIGTGAGFFEEWDGRAFPGYPNGQAVSDGTGGHIFRWFLGPAVGTGGMGGSAGSRPKPNPDKICVTPDVCIPPNGAVKRRDRLDDVSNEVALQGANLYGASLAHRPGQDDLFAVIELDRMPILDPLGATQPLLYGLRFQVGTSTYEVRSSSLAGGTFSLFDCSPAAAVCEKIGDLSGGYGTTGARVVVSLPLDAIGLEDSGSLSKVQAYSALGSLELGPVTILDSLRVK